MKNLVDVCGYNATFAAMETAKFAAAVPKAKADKNIAKRWWMQDEATRTAAGLAKKIPGNQFRANLAWLGFEAQCSEHFQRGGFDRLTELNVGKKSSAPHALKQQYNLEDLVINSTNKTISAWESKPEHAKYLMAGGKFSPTKWTTKLPRQRTENIYKWVKIPRDRCFIMGDEFQISGIFYGGNPFKANFTHDFSCPLLDESEVKNRKQMMYDGFHSGKLIHLGMYFDKGFVGRGHGK